LINSLRTNPALLDHDWAAKERIEAFAAYPLILEETLMGVMEVFGRESFRESIPAIAKIIDFRRRKLMHVGKGGELNARRRHRVKTGKLASGSIESKRELLGAIAEEIPAGDDIILVKGVVDLRNHAGQVVERRGDRRVVRFGPLRIEATGIAG